MEIEIFNSVTREVSLTKADQTKLHTKEDKWYWGMLVAIGLRIVRALVGASTPPLVFPYSVTDTPGGTLLRDSDTPARVRITNNGPDTLYVTYGETAPTPSVTLAGGAGWSVFPIIQSYVASDVIPAHGSVDSPGAIVGKIRGITISNGDAKVTVTVFC